MLADLLAGRVTKAVDKPAAEPATQPRKWISTAPPQADTYDLKPAQRANIETIGDQPWFVDTALRQNLRETVATTHREQKIVVGVPETEIKRISPGGGRVLGAQAVLRLGGTFGGFGESDINYVFRQLSRALHPDKNPGVVEAPDAFKRLAEAADELREGLTASRTLLQQICLYTSTQTEDELMARPQEALFAEASKLLSAVMAIVGEGKVDDTLLQKAVTVVRSSPTYNGCEPLAIQAQFWAQPVILEIYTSPQLRSAYDCAPKRQRTQFLCDLNRLSVREADRNGGCVRSALQTVMEQYPELGLCRMFRDKLQRQIWLDDGYVPTASSVHEPDDEQHISGWAKPWRDRLRGVCEQNNYRGRISLTDPDLQDLVASTWFEIVRWANSQEPVIDLSLFVAQGMDQHDPTSKWIFVPSEDVILTVGEGMLGMTAEGLFLAKPKVAGAGPKVVKEESDEERDRDLGPTAVKIPWGMQGVPPPSAHTMQVAQMSALAQGYDATNLPKHITCGCHAKWGIGLWCKKCNAYVAWVKKNSWDDGWWISDDGGCAHFGGQVFKTGRLATTATSSGGRMELGEVVSDHDMQRAVLAAIESRASFVGKLTGGATNRPSDRSSDQQASSQSAATDLAGRPIAVAQPATTRFDQPAPMSAPAGNAGGSEGITLMSLMKKQRTDEPAKSKWDLSR